MVAGGWVPPSQGWDIRGVADPGRCPWAGGGLPLWREGIAPARMAMPLQFVLPEPVILKTAFAHEATKETKIKGNG